jgi:AmmeMemoRadiSam system protein B
VLAPLRGNLDFMPSPVEDRPGLLIRDPFGYADQILIVPPPLVRCLACFDGERTEGDLRQALVDATGELAVGELLRHLLETLGAGGFLDNEAFARRRDGKHRDFASSPRREPSHAGSAYPADAEALRATLERYLAEDDDSPCTPDAQLVGIAAPHVSPEGGFRCYAAAYRRLRGAALRGRTVIILGTSHYGEPGRFGLTRKAFVTPHGEAATDVELVDQLASRGGAAVALEDYCHAVEHSIEFQVIFLQQLLGADVRIVPILCGPLDASARAPEDDEGVARFLEVLAEVCRAESDRLLYVLGVDMAHVGRRYGDRASVSAGRGVMTEVESRDRERLARIAQGDATGFWALVKDGAGDALRWCGSAPLYVFLRVARPRRAELLRYEQWNIDADSVVSFAALAFTNREAAKGMP